MGIYLVKKMSYFIFGNCPISVPPVLDTTPCMYQMLTYEDCIGEAKVMQQEIIHPNWPTMYPRMLTDGKLLELDMSKADQLTIWQATYMRPLTSKNKQYLWECEEERFVYKSCLRKMIGLQRSAKHTSWDNAEVANIQLT